MHSIFYYIPVYLILGAVGMALANRKTDLFIRRQRWLKYFSYVLITGILILSIFLQFFGWVSFVIVTAGFIELGMVNFHNSKSLGIGSFIIYGVIAAGFVFFAFYLKSQALLFIYFQVLIFDAFGQITGQLFGKHLIVSKISPAKTIEGLAGGWLFCIVSALLAAAWVNLSIYQAFILGLFTGLTSFTGDILASWYKRLKRVKDYSTWLPGQGGFLDRFDSLIFTAAAYFLGCIIFKTSFLK